MCSSDLGQFDRPGRGLARPGVGGISPSPGPGSVPRHRVSPLSARLPPDGELSGDQEAAAAAFAAWLAAPEDGTPFLLRGYAGTGKTTLSMRFLARAEAQSLCWTVVAPTHKAVGVLRDHLEQVGLSPTWFPSTIHRLLRLKLKIGRAHV